ncbi:MAG: class I SAM-dependent methyltransferase [Reyranellaceae bacterium]
METSTMASSPEFAAESVSIETIASYWNARPCNIRHSSAPVGTEQYFNAVEERKYLVEPHIPGFAEFPRWRNRKVLEIGCGIGTDAINFARHGAEYTGVELSQVSLALAQRRFAVFGLEAKWLLCNAETLSNHLAPESFDLVYSFGVLHHTPDPAKALREARKLIAPNGELRLMVYARDSWKDAMIEASFDQPEAQSGCPLARRFRREEATDLLAASGFAVVSIEQDHIFPYVIEKYVRYEYELQPWFAAMPKEIFRALEKRFGWHLLIKATPVA